MYYTIEMLLDENRAVAVDTLQKVRDVRASKLAVLAKNL